MLRHDTLPKAPGKKKKRVGRGNASSGNYSGRGMKGQRSRSGGKSGLKLRGLKQSMLAVPKTRGFSSKYPVFQEVSLSALDKQFDAGATVTAAELKAKRLVKSVYAPVKVLATGSISKKLTVKLQGATKAAQEAITKAGGTFEQVPTAKRPKKSAVSEPTGKKTVEKKSSDQ